MKTNLKKLREERGLSEVAISAAAGIAQASYRKYENQDMEESSIPLHALVKLANFYEVPLDVLLNQKELSSELDKKRKHWHERYTAMLHTELKEKPINLDTIKWDTYPFNLLSEMFQMEELAKDNSIHADVIPMLEKIRARVLSNRNNQILMYVYEYGWTLEKCGKFFGITRERIRQLKEKTLSQLKYHMLAELTSEADRLHKVIQTRISLEETLKDKSEEIANLELLKMPLEKWNFSNRLYNALYRNDLNNMSDIIKYNKVNGSIVNLRTLGEKSLKELLTVTHQNNIHIY